jgi:hypothetical protein
VAPDGRAAPRQLTQFYCADAEITQKDGMSRLPCGRDMAQTQRGFGKAISLP